MANANLITETFTLPSKGILNKNIPGGNITLRMMTTKEERMRLSSEAFYEIMSLIINDCIVDNIGSNGTYKIDSKDFTDFDFFATMVKLRSISYGPQYKTAAKCPICGKTFNFEADLSTLTCIDVPDDFIEPFEIGPLPHSGDTLGCRFLRVRDRIAMEKEKNNILQRFPNYVGDPLYMLEMYAHIMSVNGTLLNSLEIQKYVDNMSAKDSNYYHRCIDKYIYGINRISTTTCTCGSTALWAVRADNEFFRPTLDI